jgi:DNA polymerase I-like protein with 3'-5' exonuclease and polymerase domains
MSYTAVNEPNLFEMQQREFSVASASVGKKKSPRLTAKQLAINNALPEGTDHDNAVEVYQFIAGLPATATVAFDTETSYRPDVKSVMASQIAIRFVQFAHAGKAVCSRVTADNHTLIQMAVGMLLTDPNKVVLIHNAPFDLSVCDRLLGVPHRSMKARVVDTLLLSQWAYLGSSNRTQHNLGACLMRELGVDLDKGAQSSDWRLPVEQDRWEYINNDVLYLEQLARKLYNMLHHENPALLKGWERERFFVSGPATAMAINGFRVNRAKLASDLAGVSHEIATKSQELTKHVGQDPAYEGAKAKLEATIVTKEALIARNTKRAPGAAEDSIKKARAALAELSPNFKYRSNKEKLALLAGLRPTLLRLYYQQAVALIGEDSNLQFDALFYSQLAQKLETKDDLSDTETNATLTAGGILADVQLAIDDFEVAAAAISKSAADARVLCAQSPQKLQRMFESIASEFANTTADLRVRSCTATNWKLIRSILTANKDQLTAEETVWLTTVELFIDLAKRSKKESMLTAYSVLADVDPGNPRLRSSYKVLGAKTGRTSSTGPNLQNVDRSGEMRKLFVATPGYRLAVFDASQIELRVAFALANEVKGLAAFAAGKDLHTVTALLIWGEEFKRVLVEHGVATAIELEDPDTLYTKSYYFFDDDAEYAEGNLYYYLCPEKGKRKYTALGQTIIDLLKPNRQRAKSANFGLLYGAGWRGLQGYIFSSSGETVTEAEARDLRAKFFAAYPDLAAWHARLAEAVNRYPAYLGISADTRRLMPPEWRDGGYQMNSDLKLTVAANTPVQGLAAIILKDATNAVYNNIVSTAAYSGVRLLASVHDEIVLEFPDALDHDWLVIDIQRTLYGASQHPLLEGKVEIKYAGGLCSDTNTWADK